MVNLTSRNNPKIKQLRLLLNQRKAREDSSLFVAEGIHHVGEAVQARARIEYLCYSPALLTSEFANRIIHEQVELGVACLAVDAETFTSLAGKENPQGILAVIHKPDLLLKDLSPQNFPCGVALLAPQDPGNIGTILRTIDATGASGLLLLDDPAINQFSSDPSHPSAVRASMGTIFWHPVVSASFGEFVSWAKANFYAILGTSAHAAHDYRQADGFEEPLILLMGSERDGLNAGQSAACDVMLKIPMLGRVSSLNLAVATGLILYSVLEKKLP